MDDPHMYSVPVIPDEFGTPPTEIRLYGWAKPFVLCVLTITTILAVYYYSVAHDDNGVFDNWFVRIGDGVAALLITFYILLSIVALSNLASILCDIFGVTMPLDFEGAGWDKGRAYMVWMGTTMFVLLMCSVCSVYMMNSEG